MKSESKPRLLDRYLGVRWSDHPGLLLALFGVLGLILVAPVWTVRYPPLIDFPNHLASSFVLAHLHDPRFEFSKYYASNWNLGPYLTMDLILVGLQAFLPVMLTARIFLSLCLLAVPPAVWFFLKEANPGEERLAFWSLLLCSNMFLFLYGMLNLQLSFALCFVVLGFWLRYRRNPGPSLWWLLCGLTTALYFTHIGGFVVAGVVVTCYLILGRRPLREIVTSWLLFLPGVALYSYWKLYDAGAWPIRSWGMREKIPNLVAVMLGYSPWLDFLTLVVILACVILACADNPELRWNKRWLGVLACLLAMYVLTPAYYGPGMMADRRLLPFIFVVALAGAKLGRRGRYLVPVALLLFMIRTGNVEVNFRSMQPRFEKLSQSFSIVPANIRLFPLIQQTGGKEPWGGMFWAYGVIQRGWFSPYLFHDKGVQPLRIRVRTYTPAYLYLSESAPGPPDWRKIQEDYDYIWAYGASGYSRQMASIGKLVLDSEGLRVYQLTNGQTKRHQKAKDEPTVRQQMVTPEARSRLDNVPKPSAKR
ncbi:MAG: hypothetical protein P8Z30_02150 [Acidobacteriota bacterium]